MSRFLTGNYDIVKEEYIMTILQNDMNVSRIIVYDQYIEESKLESRGRDVKRGRTDKQGQPWFKKRTPNQDVPIAPKAKY